MMYTVFYLWRKHAASYLYDIASYAEARKLGEQALAIVEQVHSEEHSQTAYTLHCLGNIYESLGLSTHALALYERALAIAERVWGPEHADTARILNDLGEHFQMAGESHLAEEPLPSPTFRRVKNTFLYLDVHPARTSD